MALCPVPLNSRNYSLYYVVQTECDVLPESPVFKRVSLTGGSPVLSRDTLQSATLDGSSEVTGIRLGSSVVNLEIAFELMFGVHDDLIEFVMQSSWVNGTTQASKSIVISSTAKTATISGEDLTSVIKANDYVVMPSLTGGNAEPLLVTAIAFSTDTTITFGAAKKANPQISLVGLEDETGTSDIKVSGSISVGTDRKLASFLTKYDDIDGANKYQLVMDCEVTQFTFNPTVNANITGTFTVIGKTLASAQALPTGASFATELNKKPLTGIDGSIVAAGARVAFSESMTYTLNRAGEASYELGSAFMAFVDYGKTTSEMSVTSKFVDFTTAVLFESLSPPDVAYNFTSSFDGDCIGFSWPTCALTGFTNSVGEGTIPQEVTLVPYKPVGAQSSLTIHRVSSNA